MIVFRVLPHDWPPTFSNISTSRRNRQLLRAMAHEQVVGILNEMSPDDRTALLEELPSAGRAPTDSAAHAEERRTRKLCSVDPEEASAD